MKYFKRSAEQVIKVCEYIMRNYSELDFSPFKLNITCKWKVVYVVSRIFFVFK